MSHQLATAHLPQTIDPAYAAQRAADVVDRIWDTARWKPLVLVSCAVEDVPKVPTRRLASAIGDAAELVLIPARQAWELQRLLPRGFEAYGGAIRVVLPDATQQDPAERHPLFFTFDRDDPNDTISRICAHLARHGFTRTTPSASEQQCDSPRQQRRTEKLRDAQRQIARLEHETTTLAATINKLRDERDAAAAEVAQARRDVDALTAELDQATCPHAIVYSDPEAQLRHELWLTWLSNTPETDRAAQPLCDYDLGPDFLESMDLQLVPRGRILDVVVDVLTRRVHQIPARRSHPLRSADAGNAPQRTRADGAAAWRCDLKTGKAGGPRLAWWQHTDGRIELGKAGHHDDYTLR
ncbi:MULTISPECIES: hypothetical protein [unclassified Nocardioides]|uniref:hypothetical protein n=1 Tax=unclassified Nocardioides TaxID=2615069 RepID=UPI0009EFB0C5|nr:MULTISPECIES: hypothetical protein [unclassified Nocardioides]GAW52552.1 hypothetical protein PD653B2_4910 [Nocardioides sp. PD653-B2]GAW55609.1 hypothetical protein PD653_3034 [Nocardioides sp. PD653]